MENEECNSAGMHLFQRQSSLQRKGNTIKEEKMEQGRYTLAEAIVDYTIEIQSGVAWKRLGHEEVSADVAGRDLANGRATVSINEYLDYFTGKLCQLMTGKVNPEDYEY